MAGGPSGSAPGRCAGKGSQPLDGQISTASVARTSRPLTGAQDDRPLNAAGMRPFLNDLHRLHLSTMAWEHLVTAGAVPRGRCQAVIAASQDAQLLLVYGGACHHEPAPGQQYGARRMTPPAAVP